MSPRQEEGLERNTGRLLGVMDSVLIVVEVSELYTNVKTSNCAL